MASTSTRWSVSLLRQMTRYPPRRALCRPIMTGGADTGEGVLAADHRLSQELERMRANGLTADGEVGDPDPLQAITDTLAQREVDEIILATLPPGISRWLGQDLVHRVRRKFPMTVTHVISPI